MQLSSKMPNKFLTCVEDKFLFQKFEDMIRRLAVLDIVMTNWEELRKDIKVMVNLRK